MQKKILVTGANGQLGMELRRLATGYPQYQFVFTTREEMPLDSPTVIEGFITSAKPDYIVNCAAYTAVDKAESEKELAYRINAEAPATMASICAREGIGMIHISTDYVFNGLGDRPYKEDDPTDPVNMYGASKLEGEKNVLGILPFAIILRTAWVYSEFGKNFVRTMLRLMSERQEIGVVSDQFGTPTYAADLAIAIIKIIDARELRQAGSAPSGVFHFSNNGHISWFDFAVAIAEISGAQCKVNPITTEQFPTPARRPAYSVLDKTKITREFGIIPPDWRPSLEECIRRMNRS